MSTNLSISKGEMHSGRLPSPVLASQSNQDVPAHLLSIATAGACPLSTK